MVAASMVVIHADRGFREVVAVALGARGWTVETADAPWEGLAVTARRQPDAVLLDWVLASRLRTDLTRRLHLAAPGCRLLVVGTGGADADPAAHAAGVDGVLGTPFRLPDLLAALAPAPAAIS